MRQHWNVLAGAKILSFPQKKKKNMFFACTMLNMSGEIQMQRNRICDNIPKRKLQHRLKTVPLNKTQKEITLTRGVPADRLRRLAISHSNFCYLPTTQNKKETTRLLAIRSVVAYIVEFPTLFVAIIAVIVCHLNDIPHNLPFIFMWLPHLPLLNISNITVVLTKSWKLAKLIEWR